jgi:hypothetical protein
MICCAAAMAPMYDHRAKAQVMLFGCTQQDRLDRLISSRLCVLPWWNASKTAASGPSAQVC